MFSIDPSLRPGRFIVLICLSVCMSVCLSAILSRPIYFCPHVIIYEARISEWNKGVIEQAQNYTGSVKDCQIFKEIQNLEWLSKCFIGPRVTEILLNGCILPIGGGSAINGVTQFSFNQFNKQGIIIFSKYCRLFLGLLSSKSKSPKYRLPFRWVQL